MKDIEGINKPLEKKEKLHWNLNYIPGLETKKQMVAALHRFFLTQTSISLRRE